VASARSKCATVAISFAVAFLSLLSLALSLAAADADGRVTVRIIVVDAADQAARILQQLTAGADFAALARQQSTDATGMEGGLLGQVDPATLRPELREALQGMRSGDLSHVVKIASGYAILKVVAEPVAASSDSADRARLTALAAPGSIVWGPEVDGLAESWSALATIPKPESWDQDPHAICEVHARAYFAVANWVDRMLNPSDERDKAQFKDATPTDWIEMHISRGQLHAFKGEMPMAIEQFETPTGWHRRMLRSCCLRSRSNWESCTSMPPRWRTTCTGIPVNDACPDESGDAI
jgi:hypothetical protein